ncbi:MAG: 3-deoxy-D-manno-octulosonic acid transferase [Prevotellaceae bacterium]|jgi:3-deoxy-D-manno-octulosonic-acid transferase|nr:3-deoxy-D-manno-octulosonic acid transferase [Prevotellaceae bacterium]
MIFLYNVGLLLFWVVMHVAALFYPKARKLVCGHWGALRKLKLAMDGRGQRKVVWFHCASLGEFEQGRPVIEALRKRHPDAFVLLTFFSPSGYEVRKNYAAADYVCYMPLDLWWVAHKFVKLAAPHIAVFVKYEFWYNYFRQLNRHGAKTYVISAIFREQQAFFNQQYGKFFVRVLNFCEHIFVQNSNSLDLLASVGISNASCAGDTRFDRVLEVAAHANALPELAQFAASGKLTLVAGSTWPPDEDLLAELVNKVPNMKLIVAPHEVGESRVCSLLAKFGKPALPYSQWQKNMDVNLADYSVFVVDAVGFLSSLYRFGSIAYVGGGFGVGIHNILEAAVFGVPVIFGDSYKKFCEATDLVEQGGAFSVSSLPELLNVVGMLSSNKQRYEQSGNTCRTYVQQHKGATEIIMKQLSCSMNILYSNEIQ